MPGATEISLIWGNKLSFQTNGDVAISQDVQGGTPQATFERVLRIVMTNPTLYNSQGQAIGRPDDLFNPTFGSGVRAAIGESYTPALVQNITAAILGALATDPFILQSPAPTVTLVQGSNVNTYLLTVSCTSIDGLAYTLPSFQITAQGLVSGVS